MCDQIVPTPGRLGIVHRNLRLEKLLLDGQAAAPMLKISGFAYSKAPDLDSGEHAFPWPFPLHTCHPLHQLHAM